uniref:NADH-ubiquinone oxidoreductase chain 4L n=1 Tax=Tarentola mauritanica TaxID=8569 RepID=H9CXP9_TARMA|nr:NADH dehydrogenase subunit 4L [Tarentola mauritanica]
MSQTQFFTSMMLLLGLMGLTSNRKHLVSALLCLETMMLALFMALTHISQTTNTTTTYTQPLILLTISACEAGVGLALLVASSRTHTLSHLKTLNLLKC